VAFRPGSLPRTGGGAPGLCCGARSSRGAPMAGWVLRVGALRDFAPVQRPRLGAGNGRPVRGAALSLFAAHSHGSSLGAPFFSFIRASRLLCRVAGEQLSNVLHGHTLSVSGRNCRLSRWTAFCRFVGDAPPCLLLARPRARAPLSARGAGLAGAPAARRARPSAALPLRAHCRRRGYAAATPQVRARSPARPPRRAGPIHLLGIGTSPAGRERLPVASMPGYPRRHPRALERAGLSSRRARNTRGFPEQCLFDQLPPSWSR